MNNETIMSQLAEALLIIQKQAEIITLNEKEIKSLKERIEWMERKIFGRKSEHFNPNQFCFDSLLIEAIENNPPAEPESAPEPEVPVTSHTRKKKSHGRSIIPDHIRREYVDIDIPEEQKILPDGRERQLIGYDESQKLVYEPSQLYVKVTRRYKYSNPTNDGEPGVLQAPLPETLLPRCLADDTLLAHVAVSKYGDHLPAYRLEQIFKRSDVHIPRQTICGWMIALGLALWPIVNAIKQKLFEIGLIHNDDTIIDLLEANEKKADSKKIRKARMWLSCAGPRDGPWTVFDFTVTRNSDGPNQFFDGYSGKIVCDAYSVYDSLANASGETKEIILYGCWAHTRRYFFNAYKGGEIKYGAEFIALIKLLYDVESEINDKCKDENDKGKINEIILGERQRKCPPILNIIKQRIDTLIPITPPKSLLSKALIYAKNNWDKLIRYVDDPQASIDNNIAERAIRSVALSRKNWLFVGSRESGKAAANIMSIISTCKRAGVEPYAYLLDIIRRLPTTKDSEIDSLLPTYWVKSQTVSKT